MTLVTILFAFFPFHLTQELHIIPNMKLLSLALTHNDIIYLSVICFILFIFLFSSLHYYIKYKTNAAIWDLEKKNFEMRTAMQNSNINLWSYDVENDLFKKTLGQDFFRNGDTRSTCEEFIDPQYRKLFYELLDALILKKKNSASMEIKLVHGNKKDNYFQLNLSTRYNKENKVESIIGVALDISEQKLLETMKAAKEKAEKAQKKAEISGEVKSRFLANMSHEIRTPLNAIVGFATLAISANDKKEREKYSKIVETHTDQLLTLINDLLDLQRIEEGNIILKNQPFNLTKAIEELAAAFRITLDKDVILNTDFPQKEVVCVLDRKRILQIVNNFTTNAVKYTTKGFITIGVEDREQELYLFVKDSGIGISEENKDRIFEGFEKENQFIEGAGLGLSICKAITKTYKGQIGVESQLGKGSTFWATIPISKHSESSLTNVIHLDHKKSYPSDKKSYT